MKLTADTNLLLRATMNDDAIQSAVAQRLLSNAELIAIPSVAVCEFAWVLSSYYKLSRRQIGEAIRRLAAAGNVRLDIVAIESGLAILDGGGDFADGVIAAEGRGLGGTVFASFDRAAVKRVRAQGVAVLDPVAR